MGSFVARTLDLLVEEGHPEGAPALRTAPFSGASIDAACPAGQIPSAGYKDTVDEPYRDAIDCAAHWRVMFGARQDEFVPRTLITRGQAATLVARVFDALGGTRPQSPPNAYRDDEGSVHERSADLLAAIGASPVGTDRLFRPQDRIAAQELVGFLNGVYAARSGGTRPFSSTTKDRPVLRAELAAELVGYLSRGVQDGYASVP
jgi:hypothetical protein